MKILVFVLSVSTLVIALASDRVISLIDQPSEVLDSAQITDLEVDETKHHHGHHGGYDGYGGGYNGYGENGGGYGGGYGGVAGGIGGFLGGFGGNGGGYGGHHHHHGHHHHG